MFESLGFENLTAPQAVVYLGLISGLLFGVLAQRTRFCFRRSVVGPRTERRPALGVWLMALAAAIAGVQGAVASGLIDFGDHRFMASSLPVVAIVTGGLMFGAGMVLTRGCISRLTVLSGTGNLRAATVLLVFAVAAHATIKGVLSPLRTGLGGFGLDLGSYASLASLPGGALLWSAVLGGGALIYALRSGNRRGTLLMAAALGLLVPAAWVGTGFVLYDDFDPIAMESLSFTSPSSDTIFWLIASSSIPAGFGAGLIGGVILGSLGAALTFREFSWQSFESPAQTGRYGAGAVLMGVGGVLAGGCTVGAGLAGIPTLSVAALLALSMIAIGAKLADAALVRFSASEAGSGGPSTTPQVLPAE